MDTLERTEEILISRFYEVSTVTSVRRFLNDDFKHDGQYTVLTSTGRALTLPKQDSEVPVPKVGEVVEMWGKKVGSLDRLRISIGGRKYVG